MQENYISAKVLNICNYRMSLIYIRTMMPRRLVSSPAVLWLAAKWAFAVITVASLSPGMRAQTVDYVPNNFQNNMSNTWNVPSTWAPTSPSSGPSNGTGVTNAIAFLNTGIHYGAGYNSVPNISLGEISIGSNSSNQFSNGYQAGVSGSGTLTINSGGINDTVGGGGGAGAITVNNYTVNTGGIGGTDYINLNTVLASNLDIINLGNQYLNYGVGNTMNLSSYTLTLVSTNTFTNAINVAAAISGTGGVTKIGGGVATLSGSNTYSGNTTVNSGTLVEDFNQANPGLLSASTSTLTDFISNTSTLVLGGGTFNVLGKANAAGSAQTGTFTGGSTNINLANVTGLVLGEGITGSNIPSNDYITAINGNTITLAAATSGSGSISETITPVASTVTTKQSFAGLTLNPGGSAIVLNSNGAGGTNLSLGAITRNGGSALDVTFPASGTITTTTTTTSPIGDHIVVDGNGTAYGTANGGSTWLTNNSGTLGAFSAYTTGDYTDGLDVDVQNGDGAFNANVNTLRFNAGTDVLTLAGTGVVQTGGILVTSATSSGTVTGGSIRAGAGKELVFADYGNLNVASGIIDSAGGASILTKAGSGTLTLSGSNSYTGGTYFSGGVLNVGNGGALGSTGTLFFNGGTLQYSASNTTDYSSRFSTGAGQQISVDTNGQSVTFASNLSSSNGSLTKSGSGTLTLSGSNTYSGQTTLNGGVLQMGSANGLTANTFVTLNSGTLSLNNNNISIGGLLGGQWTSSGGYTVGGAINLGSGTLTIGGNSESQYIGIISGTGGIVKTGNSELYLGAQNGGSSLQSTYSGPTTIENGILVANGNASPTGGAFGASQTLLLGDANSIANNWNVALYSEGNTWSGGVTISQNVQVGSSTSATTGTYTLGDLSNSTQNGSSTWSGTMTLNQPLVVANASRNMYISGPIIDGAGSTAGVTYSGNGTIILSGASTYTGTSTIVPNTTVQIGNAGTTGALSPSSTINDNGTLVFNRTNAITQSTDFGNITGSGNVSQIGSGTVTFNQGTTYTGSTSLSAGTLNVTTNGVINNGSPIYVAPTGTSKLVVSGGLVESTNSGTGLYVGNSSTANGVVIVNSGTLMMSGSSYIGSSTGSTSFGSLTINGGVVTSGSYLALDRVASGGNTGGAGYGVLNMNGGTLTVTANQLDIGAYSSTGLGLTNVSGGTINIGTGTGSTNGVYVGEYWNGVLNMTGGALNILGTSGVGLQLGVQSTSSVGGIVNLNGGTLTTYKVSKGAGGGTLNFSGGTLQANSANASFLNGLTNVFVQSGGGTINNGGNAITIGQVLAAPVNSGVTTIALGAGGSGYLDTPVVTISGGTLAAGGVAATAVANINYATGQITGFTITNPGNYTSTAGLTVTITGGGGAGATAGTISTGSNTSGGMAFSGSGTTTLNANNSYTGGTTVNNGMLLLNTGGGTGAIIGTLTINAGATVNAAATNAFGFTSNSTSVTTVNINGGTLESTASGDQGWSQVFNLTGGTLTSVGSSYWDLGAGAAVNSLASSTQSVISGGLILRADGQTNDNFTVAQGTVPGGAPDLLVSANISQANPHGGSSVVGLTKLGAGTMALTGSNSYSGVTTISAGVLQLGNGGTTGTLSPSGTILDNATFAINRSNAAVQGTDFSSSAITGTGGLLQEGSGTTTLNAANTFQGNTTLTNGTLAYSGTASMSSSSTITLAGANESILLRNNTTGTFATPKITTSVPSTTFNVDVNNLSSGSTQTLTLGTGTLSTATNGSLTLNVTGGNGFVLSLPAVMGSSNTSGTYGMTFNATTAALNLGSILTGSFANAIAFTGTNTINLGVLSQGSNGGNTVTIGTNGGGTGPTVNLNGANTSFNSRIAGSLGYTLNSGTLDVNNAGALANLNGGGNATLTINGGTINNTSGAAVAGNAGLVTTINNSFAFGTSSGTTTNNLTLGMPSSSSMVNLASSSTVTLNGNDALSFAGTLNYTGNNLTLTVNNGAGAGANTGLNFVAFNLSNSATNFNDTINGSGTVTISGAIANGGTSTASSLAYSGTGALILSSGNTNSFSGGFTLNSGTLDINGNGVMGSGTFTINGGTVDSTSGVISLSTNNPIVIGGSFAASATHSINFGTGAVTLAGSGNNYTITLKNFTDTFGGNISGADGLTVAGNGTPGAGILVLNGSNSYTGGTTINGGNVQVGNANALGTAGNAAVTFGASSNGYLTLNGFNITLTDLKTNATVGTPLIQDNNATSAVLTLNTANSDTYAGVMQDGASGVLGFTKLGIGSIALTGLNTYTGTTTIGNGVASINSVGTNATAQSLGEGTTVNLGVAGSSSGKLVYTGGTGTLTKAINALGNGSDTIQNSGSGSLTLSGPIVKNGTKLTIAGGNGINITGVISGANSGSDLIIDTGTTTLGNANTYNGPTYIRDGATLNANVTGALPTGTLTNLVIDDTGSGSSTLALGASQAVSSLAGAASSSVNLGANSLTIGNSGTGTTTFAGTISGTGGSLVKNGTSTEILSGANSYSGGTTVSAGVLKLNNGGIGSATGTGALAVGGSATIEGVGTGVTGANGFNISGKVITGAGSATDTTGVTTITGAAVLNNSSLANANLAFNLDSASTQSSQLNVGTTGVNLANATLTLNLTGSTLIPNGTLYVLIAGTGGITGGVDGSQYTGIATDASGADGLQSGMYKITGGLSLHFLQDSAYATNSFLVLDTRNGADNIEVEVVPEPSTWALIAGGLGTLLLLQRRRNKS